jgi:hypothetical protein
MHPGSIPTQAKTYPKDRGSVVVIPLRRASHHVSHLHPRKTAKATAHMNAQGGTLVRSPAAAPGKIKSGIQPVKEACRGAVQAPAAHFLRLAICL